MKTNILKNAALAAVILAGMSFGGFKAFDYSHAKKVNSDDAMLIANIEALSDGEEGGEETVKCYCKKKILAPNVCTVMGSGGYCGGDPCSNHDGNCR